MSLNIGGSGIAKPFVKFNAKADKWFVRGADGEDAEIQRPTFVIDLDNIATGWVLFREGQAPERVMDPSLDQGSCPARAGAGTKAGRGATQRSSVLITTPEGFGPPIPFPGIRYDHDQRSPHDRARCGDDAPAPRPSIRRLARWLP